MQIISIIVIVLIIFLAIKLVFSLLWLLVPVFIIMYLYRKYRASKIEHTYQDDYRNNQYDNRQSQAYGQSDDVIDVDYTVIDDENN